MDTFLIYVPEQLPPLPFPAGAVTVVSAAAPFAERENLYLAVRAREGRRYADAEVRQLPYLPPAHPQYAEWRVRGQSGERLRRYLGGRGRPLRILDLGCGTGWLTHALAAAGHTVWGVDLNRPELEQGARVFGTGETLQFLYADVFDTRLPLADLDAVVIAAAGQYFPDLRALIGRLLALLRPGGEIHVLDTPFYTPATIAAARARTRAYYAELGFPEMAAYYQHHLSGEMATFKAVERNRAWYRRWPGRTPPFPWYVITKP